MFVKNNYEVGKRGKTYHCPEMSREWVQPSVFFVVEVR